jgi:hypothetical protein
MELTFTLHRADLSSKAHAIDTWKGIRFIPKKFPFRKHNRFFVTIDIPQSYADLFMDDLASCTDYADSEFKRLVITN